MTMTDMFEQAYHGVQKALDYALGTDETAGAGAGIVADAMLLAQRYMELRGAVLAGEAGAHTVERLEDPERTEALLIRYERAVEALRPVEGSTPIASPAPERCDAKLAAATGDDDDLHCERLESHTGRHFDGGLTWIGDDPDTMAYAEPALVLPPSGALLTLRAQIAGWRSADQEGYDPGDLADAAEALVDRLDAATPGEVVSVPPPVDSDDFERRVHAVFAEKWRQHDPEIVGQLSIEVAYEPAPVPPPVDALLDQVEARLRGHFHGIDGYAAKGHAASAEDCTPCYETAEVVTDMITEVRAAGVEEGRRQRDAEIHANVFTSARLAAAEAGFGPVPDSVTVSYETIDPLPPKWTRPAATEAHNIRDVLAAPQRTVPPDDHWDDRPFVEWQAAAIQQVMYRAIDDAHAAGVALGRRQATEERTETVEQLAAAECARRHHPMAGRAGEPCPGCGAEVTHHG